MEVTCRYGCGQVMKREEGRLHEEETCIKRPIEVQLARLQYLVNKDMEEMRSRHETEVGELKELIAKQAKEIAELRQSIAPSSKKDSNTVTMRRLKPDILEFMPRLHCGSVPGVSYYPSQAEVEISGCCHEEVEARAWLFKTEYQKIFRTFRARNITLPANINQLKLDDCLTQLNTKYSSVMYAFILKSKGSGQDVVMIYSIGNQHQLDKIAQAIQSQFGSMTTNYIQLSDKRRVTLKWGDISEEDVDVIVSSTTRKLAIDGRSVASALNRASNGELKKQTEEYLSRHGPVEAGGVAITKGGGSLKCKHVFHLVRSRTSNFPDSSVSSVLEKSISKVLTEAEKVKAKSVAIPAVGAGSYLLKNDAVASCLLRVVKEFKYSTDTCVTDIRIVVYNSAAYPAFLKAFGISD